MRIVRGFFRADVAEFLEAFDQRMVARDRLESPVRVDHVGAAVAHVGDGHLLPEDQRGGQGGAAAGRLALDHLLGFGHSRLHDLLERFIRQLGFQVEQVGMEFSHDHSRHGADGGVAGHFAELVAAHAVGHDVQAKGRVAAVACQRGGDGQHAVLVQVALFAHGLPAGRDELLGVETGIGIAGDGLEL